MPWLIAKYAGLLRVPTHIIYPIGVDRITPLGYKLFMDKKKNILQTVVETPEFIKQAKDCMDEQSRKEFIDFIAQNPLSGDLIPGTGGARKLRWTSDANQGKRGGARVIYYYYDQSIPIFLFTAYAKNQKANISAAEKTALYKITKMIVETYEGEDNE